MKFIALIVSLSLTSCAMGANEEPQGASLALDCPPLPNVSQSWTADDWALWAEKVGKIYGACRESHFGKKRDQLKRVRP